MTRRLAEPVGAAVLLVASLVEKSPEGKTLVPSLLICGGLAVARWPWATVALHVAAMLHGAITGAEPEAVGTIFASLIAIGLVAARLEWRPALAALVLMSLAVAVAVVAQEGPEDIVWALGVFIAPPWIGGRLVRDRRHRLEELERVTEALAAERERVESLAAEVERARIASDMRALLTVALGRMADDAERLAAAGEPPAPDAFKALHAAGAEATAELRRLLGLLHA